MLFPALAGAIIFAVAGAREPAPGTARGWRSPATRCEVMAGGLRIADELRPVVVDLCRRSSTFRRQVARLADADGLTVVVQQVPCSSTSTWQAQTVIARVGGQVRAAHVQVQAGSTRLETELIAHEFEHILEQLDGVDLKKWIGHSGVYRVGPEQRDGPIETERARQVGRLVAGEYEAASAEITALRVR
jgi:hypothetical protein